MAKVKASGPLFEKDISRRLIRRATRRTAYYAQGKLADRTPVRTGNLRRGWRVEQAVAFNTVPYAPYVDRRIKLVEKAIPVVKSFFAQALRSELKKLE